MNTTIAVVSAGLRTPSSTRLLATELGEQVAAALGDAEVVHVEVREHAHALADAMLTGFATGALREALESVAGADALVAVTPTFSTSYSGLFKAFFDALEPDALAGMPVLLAATGGTERHSLMIEHAMRPLFTYLGAEPVRTGVYAATSDFGGEGSAKLAERITRAAGELADRVRGTKRRAPADDFATVPAFETLLAGGPGNGLAR
jgi:FMN reductase